MSHDCELFELFKLSNIQCFLKINQLRNMRLESLDRVGNKKKLVSNFDIVDIMKYAIVENIQNLKIFIKVDGTGISFFKKNKPMN